MTRLSSTFGSRYPHSIQAVMLGVVLAAALTTTARAEDLSVFTTGLDSATRPNILFVLDYSGSMNDDVNNSEPSSSGLPSKATILKAAVRELLEQNVERVNAGVSLFRWASSGIKWPIADLNEYGNSIDAAIPLSATLRSKDIINSILESMDVGSSTATVSALAEAALYFRGGTVATGGVNPTDTGQFTPQTWNTGSNRFTGGSSLAAHPSTYTPANAYQFNVSGGGVSYCSDYSATGGSNQCDGKSVISCTDIAASSGVSDGQAWSNDAHTQCSYAHPDRWDGADYISPITQECQKNFIVLISDGQPTSRWVYPELEVVVGKSPSACEDLSSSIFGESPGSKTDGNCGPEIVRQLHENDQIPSIEGSNVSTYTIGFNVAGPGQEYLRRLANDGGGEFFSADQPQELTDALDSILESILGGSENFAELAIDVNKGTFSHDNRVYLPLFTPSTKRSWRGNLKGYFINEQGLIDTNNTLATVVDTNGSVRFSDTAQSFWSAAPDGNDVKLGGASEQMATVTRNLFTYTGGALPAIGVALNAADGSQRLDDANSNLTTGMLGIPSDAAARSELLNWVQTAPMGAPLHTRAVTLRYPTKTVVYAMTNQGFLHAIDATSPTDPAASDRSGGEELFAFMPPELLPNLAKVRENSSSGPHIYGLDGGITRWHDDTNNDGIVNGTEKVMLILGMRRGGNQYHALDVTDPNNPVYRWKITGGASPFDQLAQTWSRMSLITVKHDGAKERVLAFAGGYDAATLDGATSRTAASGNSIYLVDQDGDLIWSASHSDMDFSIASDLNVIDSNSDGIADRIYVGDTGGQIWRVDFGDVGSSANFTVTRLADLGTSDYQPFFYPPSVAFNESTPDPFISVAIGSGNRADPMDTSSQNRLYLLRDINVATGAPATGFSTIDAGDLYDASANLVGSSDATTATTAKADLRAASGWYIDLSAGEKSLSALVTFENKLMATTFSPIGSGSTSACGLPSTEGRYYLMDILNAEPLAPFSDTSDLSRTLTRHDRSKVISTRGIPSSPVIVFPPDSDKVQIIVDKQTVNEVKQRLDRVMWHPKN